METPKDQPFSSIITQSNIDEISQIEQKEADRSFEEFLEGVEKNKEELHAGMKRLLKFVEPAYQRNPPGEHFFERTSPELTLQRFYQAIRDIQHAFLFNLKELGAIQEYTLQQNLGNLYEDARHLLGQYFYAEKPWPTDLKSEGEWAEQFIHKTIYGAIEPLEEYRRHQKKANKLAEAKPDEWRKKSKQLRAEMNALALED